MSNLFISLETQLEHFVQICTIVLEFLGALILVYSAIKCFLQWIKKDSKITKMAKTDMEFAYLQDYPEFIALVE